MKLFGAVAAALLISAAYVGPVAAQDDDWDVEAPSAADLLTEAAIAGLDEKVAEKCDCSEGLDKYEACVKKLATSEVASFSVKKGSANLLKFFGLKKGDIQSALQDDTDFLVAACDEELNGGGDDEEDFPGDEEDPGDEFPEF